MLTAEDHFLADVYRRTGDKALALRMLAIHTVTWWMAYFNLYIRGEE